MSVESFVGVRVAGGLLPADVLGRLVAGREVEGLGAGDYHLAAGESVREAANRSWAYLRGAWSSFQGALEALPEADRATSLTRERWLQLLLRELGFGRVPTAPTGGLVADGKPFAVSHVWGHVPVHLLGWRVELDRRSSGVAGAAGASPQSLVQELLNRSDESLWALLSNGRVLRLLRDSTSLVGSAYVEFDLEAIFEGELFSDWLLLFTLCHQSRFEVLSEGGGPADCWLERWRTSAVETGARALNLLRGGVTEALQSLGTGFLTHPANGELRRQLSAGELALADYSRALLRVVYRLLFLFVAEDRGALLDPEASPEARERYARFFGTARLRAVAQRRRGGRHGDLWRALALVMDGLGAEGGRPELGLPGLGGLFETGPLDLLQERELSNEALLAAVRALSTVQDRSGGPRWSVDYRHLGAEELGSVYESLLELVPRHDAAAGTFRLEVVAGNERKTTGSYYTPASLIDCLLDSALDPLLDEASNADDPEAALLALTVCDPACGSGHFLVAAARRIAKRLAYVRSGDVEPPPDVVRTAMREVVARCIYGVDVNPLAAELAKVSLWLEALEPGRPLGFLDAHIKVGNALLGATPALLAGGLPDAAFKPIEGDDKKHAAALAKRNKAERAGQGELFDDETLNVANRKFADAVRGLGPAESLVDVHVQAQRYRALQDSPELLHAMLVADAWCAAFVQRKTPDARVITTRILREIDVKPSDVDPAVHAVIAEARQNYRFFHWHLEFPEIFRAQAVNCGARSTTGWTGGFTCILGNPPWEHTELKEKEFFEARDPQIAEAAGARRKRLIAELVTREPNLWRTFSAAKRNAEGFSHFARSSGLYPYCGRGRINTYALFAEADRTLLGPNGRLGVILPTGIATDATTQYYFRDLVESESLVSLYGFDNRMQLFVGVGSMVTFCLLTLSGSGVRQAAADFAFYAHDPAALAKPGGRFALKPDEITLLNPNTGTCPVFRTRRDAEITLAVHRRVPVLLREGELSGNPWGVSFMQGLFNMTSDSQLFRTAEELMAEGWELKGNRWFRGKQVMLPLYEAKMIHQYDHRWATYTLTGESGALSRGEKQDPDVVVLPRYWVPSPEVDERVRDRNSGWLLGFRNIARGTDERSVIAAAFPLSGVGHSMPLLFAARKLWLLQPLLTSFALDYVLRQKLGGTNLTYNYFQQLPVHPPETFEQPAGWDPATTLQEWFADRVLELVYTGWDMEQFALDLYDDGPPYVWDEERRALLRAELDAAYFHLYRLDRDEVDYVLDTFPIVRGKDEAKFGEFRTKRLILEVYDAMAKAIATGEPYRTVLDPPPGQGPRHPDRPRD